MLGRRFPALVLAASAIGVACGGDEPQVDIFSLGDVAPGDSVGLIATPSGHLEWLDRRDGAIRRLDIDALDGGDEVIATIPVSADGEQRGLLGQVVIDNTRYAAWTQPDTNELVVGTVVDGGPGAIVWNAGEAGSGAIGGVLDEFDGHVLLGLGRNTEFDADTGDGGAILAIDPADAIDGTDPTILSVGYTNPWAFAALDDGSIWVADNAAGPDPDDESVDDIERIGRGDIGIDRSTMERVEWAGRAPSAMVELPDGRLGICGFLDNELRAYDIVETDDPQRPTLERAGTVMPCLTGAAVFDDGTVATIAQTDTGMAIHILRP